VGCRCRNVLRNTMLWGCGVFMLLALVCMQVQSMRMQVVERLLGLL
jgi:hypothetical protein